jgi:hypothetical protein
MAYGTPMRDGQAVALVDVQEFIEKKLAYLNTVADDHLAGK